MEHQYRRIPVGDLVIPFWKQNPSIEQVKRLVKNFDPDLFTEPKVSFRDGTYYIMDGSATVLAMKILGINDIPCIVYSGMTYVDEFELFLSTHPHRRKPTKQDMERARKAFGNG